MQKFNINYTNSKRSSKQIVQRCTKTTDTANDTLYRAIILQNASRAVDELVRLEVWFVQDCVKRTISIKTTLAKMLQQYHAKSCNEANHGLYGSHRPSQWERAIFDPPQLGDPWTDFHET